jgi:hypothetical protein
MFADVGVGETDERDEARPEVGPVPTSRSADHDALDRRVAVFIAILAMHSVTASSFAVTFEPLTNPVSWPGNGHYYQLWTVVCDVFSSWSWSDIDERASSLRHDGAPGYLATVTSLAEQEFLAGHEPPLGGLIGAKLVGDEWVWVRGPLDELGDPVVSFCPECPLVLCTCAAGCDRLSLAGWEHVPTGSEGGTCSIFSCVELVFLVEFGGRVRPRAVRLSPPTEARSAQRVDSWGAVKSSYRP